MPRPYAFSLPSERFLKDPPICIRIIQQGWLCGRYGRGFKSWSSCGPSEGMDCCLDFRAAVLFPHTENRIDPSSSLTQQVMVPSTRNRCVFCAFALLPWLRARNAGFAGNRLRIGISGADAARQANQEAGPAGRLCFGGWRNVLWYQGMSRVVPEQCRGGQGV